MPPHQMPRTAPKKPQKKLKPKPKAEEDPNDKEFDPWAPPQILRAEDAPAMPPGGLMGGSMPVARDSMKGAALLGRSDNIKSKSAFKFGPVACREE